MLGGAMLLPAVFRSALADEAEAERFYDNIIKRLEESGESLPPASNLRERLETLYNQRIIDDSWTDMTHIRFNNQIHQFMKEIEHNPAAKNYLNAMLFLMEHQERVLGRVEFSPDSLEVDTFSEAPVRYKAGTLAMREGDKLVFVFPHYIGSDWATVQSKDPSAPSYFTAMPITPRNGQVEITEDWMNSPIEGRLRETHVKVKRPASEYLFTFGDKSQGSPGWKTQTFDSEYPFFLLLCINDSSLYIPIAMITLKLHAGPCSRFRVVVPSILKQGERCKIQVMPLDRFDNVSQYDGDFIVKLFNSGDDNLNLNLRKKGRHFESFHNLKGGVHRFEVQSPDGKFQGLSNPVVVRNNPKNYLYWGDTHTHCNTSDGVGSGKASFDFARRSSLLDFVIASDHAEDLTDREWEKNKQLVEISNIPGQFVTLLAYEWTPGNYTWGGHFNFYFPDTKGKRIGAFTRQWLDNGPPVIDDIRETIKAMDNEKFRYMVIPHAHCPGNWAHTYPEVVRNVEIQSVHASFEWFGKYYLASGNKVGFVGSTDSHSGTPGDLCALPGVRTKGGLAAVFAQKLSRQDIFDDLYNRMCYGTSGYRIFLEFVADENMMGSEMNGDVIKKLECFVAGTGPLHQVQIIRTGGVPFKTFDLAGKEPGESTGRYRIYFTSSTEPTSPRNDAYLLPTKNWGDITLKLSDNKVKCLKAFNPKRCFRTLEKHDDGVTFFLLNRGDVNGYLLDTENNDIGKITMKVEGKEFVVDLSEKEDVEFESDIGRFGIQRLSESDVFDFQTTLTSIPIEEDNEYFYLKVTQIDGGVAWSSPIFVSRKYSG